MIKAVFFDFDGTLFDTSEGIFHCANYAMRKLGKPTTDDVETLSKFVGPPLRECFKVTYNLEDELLEEAVKIYRKEYFENGALRCRIYDNILPLMDFLKTRGIKIGVCTLKYDALVKYIIEKKGLMHYFDVVQGTNDEGTLTKAEAIILSCEALNLKRDEVLMIGDTINDQKGADQAEVEFLGVNWGFGYKKGKDYKGINVISDPLEILDYLS